MSPNFAGNDAAAFEAAEGPAKAWLRSRMRKPSGAEVIFLSYRTAPQMPESQHPQSG